MKTVNVVIDDELWERKVGVESVVDGREVTWREIIVKGIEYYEGINKGGEVEKG